MLKYQNIQCKNLFGKIIMNKTIYLFCLYTAFSLLISCGNGVNNSNYNQQATWKLINDNNNFSDFKLHATSLITNDKDGYLYFANSDGKIWNYNLISQKWNKVLTLDTSLYANKIHNNNGEILIGLSNGAIATIKNGLVINENSNERSIVTSLLTIDNKVFIGNKNGNIWVIDGNKWFKLNSNTLNGEITQLLELNNCIFATTQKGNLWFFTNTWKDLTIKLEKYGYTDNKSSINVLAFHTANNIIYGYFGNDKGHLWRIILNLEDMQIKDFSNITDNPNFNGYVDKNIPITALYVDTNNNIYFGNTKGNIWYFSVKYKSFQNLNKNNLNSEKIIAISPNLNNGIFITNEISQIWQIDIN